MPPDFGTNQHSLQRGKEKKGKVEKRERDVTEDSLNSQDSYG